MTIANKEVGSRSLADPKFEPTDEALSAIMVDVTSVAAFKAKKAQEDLFKSLSQTIASRAKPGMAR